MAEAFNQYLLREQYTKLPRKSFYFVRHGETDVNADRAIKRVDYDLPLNQKGRQQALHAGKIAQNLSFRKVKCSPIQRAQQTKEIMFNNVKIEHQDDVRFSECLAEVWTKMVKLEEGSGYEVCRSVQQFLSQVNDGLASALEEEDPFMIISHGGVHWAICYHLGIEDHPWKIGNCEIVQFEPVGTDQWKAKVINY